MSGSDIKTPGLGNSFTDTATDACEEHSPVVTIYIIVSIPATTPETVPEAIVAFKLVVLHVPPEVVSVSIVVHSLPYTN